MSAFESNKDVQKFAIMEGSDEQNATFVFGNEDHTLGNSLRHVLMQREEVDFCGYSVPHPYEPKMNLRLQVKEGYNVKEVLKSGLLDLQTLAEQIQADFDNAWGEFERKNPNYMKEKPKTN